MENNRRNQSVNVRHSEALCGVVVLKFVRRHPLTRLNETFSGRQTSQHMLYRRLTVRLRKD